jgi:hypothetical protein
MANRGIKSLLEQHNECVTALGPVKRQAVCAEACNLEFVGQGQTPKIAIRARALREPRGNRADKNGRERNRYTGSNLDGRHVSSHWILSG